MASSSLLAIHSAFESKKHFFLVTEAYPLGDLSQLLDPSFSLNESQLKFIAAGILLALSALHKSGIIHHALVPKNIVFSSSGYPKLANLMYAGYWSPDNSEGITCCHPNASPELLAGLPHGVASDYFGLGCVLYQLVVKAPAFPGTCEQELRNSQRHQPQLGADCSLSEMCRDFVNRLLLLDLNDRLGSGGPAELRQH